MWPAYLVVSSIVALSAAQGAQYFVTKPANTTVIQGSTAVLQCQIGNRKGAVQWAKDGFSLGFNHTIPGYDRYSMVSSNADEFNLRIVNTRLSDDTEYSCQVLPGGGDRRLQAKAFLTVHVPCGPPQILDYSNGSIVEVPFTQETLTLTCVSRLGRPAATLQWFRNGVRVTNGISQGVESSPSDKRETAKSTITIPLSNHNEENDKTYECSATNSAIFSGPMLTNVKLNILFPPGRPEISGYSNNRAVNINDTLVLTCISKGGNPLASVTWYRNSEPKDRSYSSRENQSDNKYTFKVKATDNKAIYRCEVTNLMATTPLTAEYRLKVNFPPTSVKMTGANAPVRAGRQVTLTCKTSNSNPKADVTWFARNSKVPNSRITETVRESPNGGYITESKIRVTVEHRDHNSVYTCQASNSAFGQTVADTLTLTVLYPPNPPEITGKNVGEPIRAGDLERMTCISVGGNPVANLTWYKGSTKIREAEYKSIGNIASSEIAIIVKPNDNGATYTCKANNPATTSDLVVSTTLIVNFPPKQVLITSSPSQPKAGHQMDLTCVCSSSNPAAEITWVRNGRRLAGVDLGSVDGKNGGKNTTNRLRFSPTFKDHNAIYGCRATNRLLDQSVSDAVHLSVLFKPEFIDLPDQLELKKGERPGINVTAYGNPSSITYVLYKGDRVISLSGRFRLSNGLLKIGGVSKSDKGTYTIKATNSQGYNTFNFSLTVLYPATIVDITPEQTKNEGETAVFMCEAEANPMVPNMINWTRSGFDMTRTSMRTEGNKSYLSLHVLTKEDGGKFTCIADNRIGSPARRTAELIVNFEPIIDKSTETSRSAGAMGSTVILKCKAEGVPAVAISWTRDNNPLSNRGKYSIKSRTRGDVGYESTLKIQEVDQTDYGTYVCTATNTKGTDSHSITVSDTMKPYPPKSVWVINATSSTITIRWKPGFNGGMPQSFRVRYKPESGRGYVYVDVWPYGTEIYKLKGLDFNKKYLITVLAFNEKGESTYYANELLASTSDVLSEEDISSSELQGDDELPVIIILVVCIVGVFILTLNVGLILFFIRKKKKKRLENGQSDTTSHTNTFELYGNSQKGDHSIYPPPSDDTRSYGTYDKSMDDFSDDYMQNIDQECETHVFLPRPQKECPSPIRPYSPSQKLDHHRVGIHKGTYIDDVSIGRTSPWNEETPYKVAVPRHKRGAFENGSINGDIYDYKQRNMDFNELSDRSSSRPPSRPSSRSGKTPPPPPMRSTSRGPDSLPPIPSRNYSPHEAISSSSSAPRYVPPPGSSSVLSPNIVANPHYHGVQPHQRTPSPHDTLPAGSPFRGHLV